MFSVFTIIVVMAAQSVANHQNYIKIVPNLATVGEKVHLKCKDRHHTSINWFFKHTLSNSFNGICNHDEIKDAFNQKVKKVRIGQGFSDLKIVNVSFQEAGTYKCCDDEDCKHFEKSSTLSVLGENYLLLFQKLKTRQKVKEL